MRKLLLATVAALGVTTGYGAAYAQQADDSGQSTVSAFGGTATGPVQAPGTLVVRLNGRIYSQGGILNAGNADGTYNYNSATGKASEVPFIQAWRMPARRWRRPCCRRSSAPPRRPPRWA